MSGLRKIVSPDEIRVLHSVTCQAMWLEKKSDPRFEWETMLLVIVFHFIYISQVNLKTSLDLDQTAHTNAHIHEFSLPPYATVIGGYFFLSKQRYLFY